MNKILATGFIALTLSISTMANADSSASRADIERLLQDAKSYGFTRFEELEVDDEDRFDVEGWREDGWHLDIDLSLNDSRILKEQQRKSETPHWSLSHDEVIQALDAAQQSELNEISSIEVDCTGRIEIEGYNSQHQEIELYIDRNTFDVIGVDKDT